MEQSIAISNSYSTNKQRLKDIFGLNKTSLGFIDDKLVLNILTAEGCETFVNYIEWLGLANEPEIVVLSSQHHYYYDAEEMKNVKSMINLKELNQIKHIKSFLHSIFHILPFNSCFIGCFVDNRKINGFELRDDSSNFRKKKSKNEIENGIISKFPFINMLISLLDSKTNKYLSKRSVSLLLSDHGFKVMDMTEIDGLTYFCAQKDQKNKRITVNKNPTYWLSC